MDIEIGIVLGVFGAIMSYLAFNRNRSNDTTNSGITLGTIMAKLDFMSGNILDIKNDIKELNNRQDKLDDRLSMIETKVAILESKINEKES